MKIPMYKLVTEILHTSNSILDHYQVAIATMTLHGNSNKILLNIYGYLSNNACKLNKEQLSVVRIEFIPVHSDVKGCVAIATYMQT